MLNDGTKLMSFLISNKKKLDKYGNICKKLKVLIIIKVFACS